MNILRIRQLMGLLIVGMVLVFAGVQQIVTPKSHTLSDSEVIERAKSLGMVDLKESMEKNQESTQNKAQKTKP